MNIQTGDEKTVVLKRPSTKLIQLLSKWLSHWLNNPALKDRVQRGMEDSLGWDFLHPGEENDDGGADAAIDWPIHDFMRAFFNLHTAIDTLKQCEFYFRRYPFGNRGVSKPDHLRNVCEMYFAQFYVIKSRLKIALKLYNQLPEGPKVDIGKALKQFDQAFDAPLRSRNRINHHEPFDDHNLSKLRLTGLLSEGTTEFRFLRPDHDQTYRRASSAWASRAHQSGERVETFLDAFAKVTLNNPSICTLPPSQSL